MPYTYRHNVTNVAAYRRLPNEAPPEIIDHSAVAKRADWVNRILNNLDGATAAGYSSAGNAVNDIISSPVPMPAPKSAPTSNDKKVISQLRNQIVNLEYELAAKICGNDHLKCLNWARISLTQCMLQRLEGTPTSSNSDEGEIPMEKVRSEFDTENIRNAKRAVTRTLNTLNMGLESLIRAAGGDLSGEDQVRNDEEQLNRACEESPVQVLGVIGVGMRRMGSQLGYGPFSPLFGPAGIEIPSAEPTEEDWGKH